MSDESSNILAFAPRTKQHEPEAPPPRWQLALNREALTYEVGKLIRGSGEGEVVVPQFTFGIVWQSDDADPAEYLADWDLMCGEPPEVA